MKNWITTIGIILALCFLVGCGEEWPPPPLVIGGEALIVKDVSGKTYIVHDCLPVKHYCGFKQTCGYKNICTVNEGTPK